MIYPLSILESTYMPESVHDQLLYSVDFLSDVWPLLIQHADSITNIYVFCGENQEIKLLRSGVRLSPRILSFGSLNALSNTLQHKIKYLSFYGGHLSVLYAVSSDSEILRLLLNLWPRGEIIYNWEYLLKEGLKEEVGMISQTIDLSHNALIGFGHDGDPLFVFGRLDMLSRLI